MPEKKPGKYTLQVIQIETPVGSTKANKPTSGFSPIGVLPTPPSIEDLLKNRKAVVTEFPIVYAAVGETAINDQTEAITFPNIVNPAKIGCYVKATIQKAENGTVSCDLDVFNPSFAVRGLNVFFRGGEARFVLYFQGGVFQNGLWGRPC